jgi:DNA-binding IclR family transcriptional regulator
MLIAQAGPNGISPNELARALHLPSETLNNLVRSLVETGQVAVFKINGELKYRATG